MVRNTGPVEALPGTARAAIDRRVEHRPSAGNSVSESAPSATALRPNLTIVRKPFAQRRAIVRVFAAVGLDAADRAARRQ